MKINPTILTKDKDDYIMQTTRDAGFAKELDIDVIDWSLTPGRTITAEESLDVPVDVIFNFDLMMDYPSKAVKVLIEDVRVHKIIINLHSLDNIDDLLEIIRQKGIKTAVSFHDPDQYEDVKNYFKKVDSIHIFAIQPGAQGNEFRPEMLEYSKKLKEDGFEGEIGLDGGVNKQTLPQILNFPFDVVVVGSAIAKSENSKATYLDLIEMEKQLQDWA
jgi:pentose-5-phosphate-3-epimerase